MKLPSQNLKRPLTSDGDETKSKKLPKPTRDRLSELPDLALVHILSRLFTEEAARTTVLSKRFNSLWNSVERLVFCNQPSGKNGFKFVDFVDVALGFHRRKTVERFAVKFDYCFRYKKSVDQWLSFATQKQVQSILLDFSEQLRCRMPRVPDFKYTLPKILYTNVNLVELVTCCCAFPNKGKISCSSLKLLSMTHTKLNAELISRILGGCSVLETLELRDWTGFDQLKINSSSLRVLRIVGELCPKYVIQQGEECVLEISGPKLVSLEVSGMLYRTKLQLTDLGSLANAVIAFTTVPQMSDKFDKNWWFATRYEDIGREVLESLRLVKTLTVGGSIIKALSRRETYCLSSPWSERRSLTVCMPVEWSHLGIASLMQSSPYLQSLVIRPSYCSDIACSCIELANSRQANADNKYYWKSWSTVSKCPLLNLKTVKVFGFQDSCQSMNPLVQFLEFLLINSKVLEEIVIQASRYVTRAALDEAMKLVSVQTASPDAVVQFEPPHLWVDPLCMYHQVVPMELDL